MNDQSLAAALDQFNKQKAEHLSSLKELVRIPSVSFPGFDPGPVRKSAEAVTRLLSRSGLKDVRILETGATRRYSGNGPARRANRRSCCMPTTTSSRPAERSCGQHRPSSRPSERAASTDGGSLMTKRA